MRFYYADIRSSRVNISQIMFSHILIRADFVHAVNATAIDTSLMQLARRCAASINILFFYHRLLLTVTPFAVNNFSIFIFPRTSCRRQRTRTHLTALG